MADDSVATAINNVAQEVRRNAGNTPSEVCEPAVTSPPNRTEAENQALLDEVEPIASELATLSQEPHPTMNEFSKIMAKLPHRIGIQRSLVVAVEDAIIARDQQAAQGALSQP